MKTLTAAERKQAIATAQEKAISLRGRAISRLTTKEDIFALCSPGNASGWSPNGERLGRALARINRAESAVIAAAHVAYAASPEAAEFEATVAAYRTKAARERVAVQAAIDAGEPIPFFATTGEIIFTLPKGT